MDIDFETLIRGIRNFFEENIPFNKVIGLQVTSIDVDHVIVRVDMKEELIGNAVKRILHGGVISSVLDATGGIIAAMGILKKLLGKPVEEISKALLKVGTIDLRVDFLRPGRGDFFIASGKVMRTGNKLAVVRLELHNDRGVLIAVGTGTYVVG
jgi:uncharacterized protein (TIGR00369 family)